MRIKDPSDIIGGKVSGKEMQDELDFIVLGEDYIFEPKYERSKVLKLDNDTKKVVRIMAGKSEMDFREIQKLTELDSRSVSKIIIIMREMGLISYLGSGKYQLTPEGMEIGEEEMIKYGELNLGMKD